MGTVTIFASPLFLALTRRPMGLFLKVTGWKIDGELPEERPLVAIVAPHTSNWDFPFGFAAALQLRIDVRWMGKDSLFKPPFGGIMRWLGGMPVDRSASFGQVDQAVEFLKQEPIILAITPEGTRSKVRKWKSGFYHIAAKAGAPILLVYFDYPTKTVGLGRLFWPTGDKAADLQEIQDYYKNFKGKRPDLG